MFKITNKFTKTPVENLIDAKAKLDVVNSELECPEWMIGKSYKVKLGQKRWELVHIIAKLEKEY
jgi:hypothetical protein